MKTKLIITGASGFCGNNIFQSLKKKYFTIGVYNRNNTSNNGYKIDLTKKIVKLKGDWIIHTASHHKIEDFKRSPKKKYFNNIKMVKNLINLCKSENIKNFIFFSTIDISYNHIPKNKKLYIRSKIYSEKLLKKAFDKKYLNKLYILRLPAIIGKNGNNNFLKNSLDKLKKNKKVYIWNYDFKYNNFIHITDITGLIKSLILSRKKNDSKIVNCLVSKPLKLEKIILLMKNKIKSKSKIVKINNNKYSPIFKQEMKSHKVKHIFLSSLNTINKFIKENRFI